MKELFMHLDPSANAAILKILAKSLGEVEQASESWWVICKVMQEIVDVEVGNTGLEEFAALCNK